MKSHDKDSSNCLPVKKDPWNDFYTFTLRTGASEKQASRHVHWARQFFEYIKMPLRACSAQDIKGFLRHISGRVNASQAEQARSALKVLFMDFLKVSWITSIPDKAGGSPGTIRTYHLHTARTEPVSEEHLFKKLQTEIRYLHYSIRTEHAYTQWLRRFLHFHNMKPFEDLSSSGAPLAGALFKDIAGQGQALPLHVNPHILRPAASPSASPGASPPSNTSHISCIF